MSAEVLQAARRAYDIATRNYYDQRERGGIVPLDRSIRADDDAYAAGARYKTTTPAATTVLGVWRKCKAELDAAAAGLRLEKGDVTCPVCPKPLPPAPAVSDRRLPPEPGGE